MKAIHAALALIALSASTTIDVRASAAETYRPWCVQYSGRDGASTCTFATCRALQAVAREVNENGAYEGKGVWLTTPIDQPPDYWRNVTKSRTLAIANLKGGVGKTTLARRFERQHIKTAVASQRKYN